MCILVVVVVQRAAVCAAAAAALLLWVTLFSCGPGCFISALSVSGTVFRCANVFCCARCCLCLSPLPRAVLLLCPRSFAVRVAACDSARCLVRCCCCARVVLLRAGLLVFQRVAACSAAAVCESAEGAQQSAQAAPGAGVLFICTRAPIFD